MKKTLIWNGTKAENMGVKIISLPTIQLSTERITEQEVAGRDGSLTDFDGYSPDTKAVLCDFRGANTQKLLGWLKGKGEVIFGNMPDRYYKARINNVVPLDQVIENELYTCPIQFRCQPFGYLLDGKDVLTLTAGTVLNNSKATHISLPLITIYGSGGCSVTINSRTFNITEIGGSITIDSDIKLVLNGKGIYMEGYFPYLDIGENQITWSGNINHIDLKPNWRAL